LEACQRSSAGAGSSSGDLWTAVADTRNTMKAIRLGIVAGLALAAGMATELWGHTRFRRLVKCDVQSLLTSSSAGEAGLISEAMLDDLPEPVQRYLRYAEVIGKPLVRRVHLRQSGRILLASGTPWIPLKAEQWYSVRPPGFIWSATVHVGPIPIVRARDMYRTGEGCMLIKAASLVTVADAKGVEIDQREMVRYLSEMIWFPSAFLEDNVTFEAIDPGSARVTLIDADRTATGTLFVDSEGRLTEFAARRYIGSNLETWSVLVDAYGEFEGLKLPVRGKAMWKLAEGGQEYIDVTVTALQYGD
jgi:hypothetical protein